MKNIMKSGTRRLAQCVILVVAAVELLFPASSFAIVGGGFCGPTITAGTFQWGNHNYNNTPPYVVGTCSPVNVYAQALRCEDNPPDNITGTTIAVNSTSGGWYETI